MTSRLWLVAAVALSSIAALAVAVTTGGSPSRAAYGGAATAPHEVWLLDQSDTRTGYGGLLHIYDGADLQANGRDATPETIDLGGEVSELCNDKTGANPVRPHMLAFNGGDVLGQEEGRFAIIAWVVSGHVTIHDARTREVIECLRTTPGSGGAIQAHAAWPTPDGRHLVVAQQNGKLIQRISTDWENRVFELEEDATLSLYEGTTPSGAQRQGTERPDNAPICVRPTYDGRFSFVSLRGGGAFVVDHNETPIEIVAEYDKDTIAGFGCGQIEARGKMFVNSGAAATVPPAPPVYSHNVYAIDVGELSTTPSPPNEPAPRLAYTRDGAADGHGFARTGFDRRVLAVDRERNDVTIVDTDSERIVGRIWISGELSSDPAPDLISPAPGGEVVYASLRGPKPLSGGHAATGNTPGLGVIELNPDRNRGQLVALVHARRLDTEPADPHGIGVRLKAPATTPAQPSPPATTVTETVTVPAPASAAVEAPKRFAKPSVGKAALKVGKDGKVTVRVRGAETAQGRFRGTLRIEAGDRILGARSFDVRADRTVGVPLTLSRTAQRALKGAGSQRVTIVLLGRTPDGYLARSTARVPLSG